MNPPTASAAAPGDDDRRNSGLSTGDNFGPSLMPLDRRLVLATGLMLALSVRPAQAQLPVPDAALEPELQAAIRQWARGVLPRKGRVQIDIAPLVENGNGVPITVHAQSPMSAADHVQEIVVFNERNPYRDLVRFNFSPACGRAQASARVRLATTQHLVALARMSDGSLWQHTVEVIVTLAACIE